MGLGPTGCDVAPLAENREGDVAGVQAGQLDDVAGVEGAAFALLGRGLTGVPHEVVGDQLATSLERFEQGERPVGPDQREVGVDLDHGKAPTGCGDCVAFAGVRLLSDS